jgi:hypothetical protein
MPSCRSLFSHKILQRFLGARVAQGRLGPSLMTLGPVLVMAEPTRMVKVASRMSVKSDEVSIFTKL